MFWCPDVDGPCISKEEQGKNAAVVYCRDDSYCNENLILPPPEQHICKKDALMADPTVVITGDKSCSDLYYRCDIENGRAIWNSRHCQRNRVFSLTLGVCTNECEVADPSNECTTNGDDEMCSCFDDVGDLWTGPAGSTVQHLCSDYQDNWISKRYCIIPFVSRVLFPSRKM